MKIEFFMKDLKHNISLLPKDIQKKIYIWTWRKFWREYVPLTAQVPSWYERKVIIENILFKSRIKNIHFLHLPFNIIPENKTWIMGCQCIFCSNIKYKYKRKEYIKLADNIDYFYDNMPHYWETYMKYLEDYDPFCGSGYEDQDRYELRTNTKTKFDTAIVNYYTQINNETS